MISGDDPGEPALPAGDGGLVPGEHALMRIGALLVENGVLELPARPSDARQPVAVLTPRQAKIRELLRTGMSNKIIGAELGISEGTVKNHISEIFRVLKVTNRTQAAQSEFAARSFTAPHSRELTTTMYDLEEYLHLALHANAKRDPHACIGYLKEALRVEPANSKAIYLLAIQHAEIGLIDRGIAGLTKVIAVEPGFEIARLQLALLMIDRGRTVEAREHFTASRASTDPAVRTFTEGMLLAIDGQIAEACDKMNSCLATPTANAALPLLVRGVLAKLEALRAGGGQRAKESSHLANDKRLFMGAYDSTVPSR